MTALNTVFVLNSLGVGGAERQVVSLINGLGGLNDGVGTHAPDGMLAPEGTRSISPASGTPGNGAPGRARHRIALACLKRDEALRPQLDASRCAGGVTCLDVGKGLEWGAVRRLAGWLDEQQAQVVVCTNLYALAYAALARGVSRRSRHAALMEVFHTTLSGSRREALQMHGYRALLRITDLLVYVCQAQADHWRRRGLRARRETVIHNGIDPARFAPPADPAAAAAQRRAWGFRAEDTVVGLCAVMRPEKAHGDLLQALHRVAAVRPDLRAVLIGDGPQRAAIEAAIDSRGLRHRVRVTGMLHDVRPALAACDAVAITSRAVETFSMAALEAMAMGLPLVMSDLGGAREQVIDGHTGWIYPAGDIAALAGCLAELSADRAVTMRRGALGAQRLREHFTAERMVRRYAEALEGLAAHGSPTARA